MNSMVRKILSDIEGLGCKAKIVSISHVEEMRDELFSLRDNTLDKKFYEDALSWMSFDAEKTLKHAKSIIVIAAPQITTHVDFHYQNNTYTLSIPPTYLARSMNKKVKDLLDEIIGKYGFSVQRAPIAQKQLAVKSGLAKYGRNNITYVDGMGSFHFLMSYYTDLDLLTDSWQAAEMDSGCTNCSICIDNCPTGAITKDRFLIHAEKCMTYFNEYDYDFPQWVKPEWHNALIGCMFCQAKCPKNAAFINKLEDAAVFNEEETKMLLDKVPLENLPEATIKKLDDISMKSSYSFLSRNIKVLLNDTYLK